MSNAPRPSKAERREQAKAAAEALRVQQARAAARQRTITIASIVLGLVLIGVIVALIISNGSTSEGSQMPGAEETVGAQLDPTVTSARGGVVFGQTGLLPAPPDDPAWPQSMAAEGGPVVVSVYFDFICPWCGRFEQTQAETLNELLASGDIVLDSHPIAFLDQHSNGTAFSTRAAAAAFAVAEGDSEHYLDFVQAMLALDTQPAEGTTGLTNAEIVAIAEGVGVPQPVLDQIASGAYMDYAATATDLASQDLGALSTPTILLNGQDLVDDLGVNWTEDGALAAAVMAAQG